MRAMGFFFLYGMGDANGITRWLNKRKKLLIEFVCMRGLILFLAAALKKFSDKESGIKVEIQFVTRELFVFQVLRKVILEVK